MVTDAEGRPLASASPSGYGPADLRRAYGLPGTGGAGHTVAIVDAYDDRTIESDLATYSDQYGLPPCTTANGCFRKVDQRGGTTYPRADRDWAVEIALDVEAVHGVCPGCKILLVEADSNLVSDLGAAVDTAASLGATEISNSYGGQEYAGEDDAAYDHPGVAVTASAGDSGYGASFPATSPKVVAVGGTTLDLDASGGYLGETVWSNGYGATGSGCSAYLGAQTWQAADPGWAATGCGQHRGTVDVAADGDPNTGAAIYTSTCSGGCGWLMLGGTSLSAPLIAAVYALADRHAVPYPAQIPYAHQSDSPASLHDVASGSNGTCGTSMCRAGGGYDGPTGVGTPNGLVAFGAADTTPPAVTLTSPADGSAMSDSTPAFAGAAGTADGDSSTVTVGVYRGATPSGSPVQTLTATRSGGSWAVTAPSPLADGTYTARAEQSDAAGNLGQSRPSTFTVDTQAPETTIDSGPAGSTLDPTPTFTFSSNEPGSTFDCSVDSSPFQACGSPFTAGPLPDGTNGFAVRATDAAGNVDPTPATTSFTVKTTVTGAPPASASTSASPSASSQPQAPAAVNQGVLGVQQTSLRVTLSLVRERLRRMLAKGLRARVGCSQRCAVRMTVSLPPATARRLGMRPTLGRRQASLSAAGRLMLRLPFAPRALARLGRLRSLRLRVAAVALDSQGRRFTLVRRLDCRGGKCAAT